MSFRHGSDRPFSINASLGNRQGPEPQAVWQRLTVLDGVLDLVAAVAGETSLSQHSERVLEIVETGDGLGLFIHPARLSLNLLDGLDGFLAAKERFKCTEVVLIEFVVNKLGGSLHPKVHRLRATHDACSVCRHSRVNQKTVVHTELLEQCCDSLPFFRRYVFLK